MGYEAEGTLEENYLQRFLRSLRGPGNGAKRTEGPIPAPVPTDSNRYWTGPELLGPPPVSAGPYRLSNGLCWSMQNTHNGTYHWRVDIDRHRPALDCCRSKQVRAGPVAVWIGRCREVPVRGEIARNAVFSWDVNLLIFSKIPFH